MAAAASCSERPSFLGDVGLDRVARRLGLQGHGAAEEVGGVDPAEDDRGVGHGGLGAAGAVADRAGHGARALRADVEQAALVDPGDAAAARADALHVHRREARHVAAVGLADPGLPRPRDAPVAHQAHVEGRAPGIGDDGGIEAAVGLRVGAARDGRHGGAGVDRVDRRARHVGRIHGAALRRHHQHAAAEARVPQARFQAAQVIAHERLERGVDTGRGRPAILPERRVEHVREGVGHARQVALQQRADAELVRGVHDRPEQADSDRLDVLALQRFDDLDDAVLVQRLGHGAVVGDAFGHLVGDRARHVGLGVGDREVEGLDAPALAEYQDVGMPPGGEEGGARGVAGDDGVDRVRGAVDQHLAPCRAGPRGPRPGRPRRGPASPARRPPDPTAWSAPCTCAGPRRRLRRQGR